MARLAGNQTGDGITEAYGVSCKNVNDDRVIDFCAKKGLFNHKILHKYSRNKQKSGKDYDSFSVDTKEYAEICDGCENSKGLRYGCFHVIF